VPALLVIAASYTEGVKSKKYCDISENIYSKILESFLNNTLVLVGKRYVLSEQSQFVIFYIL